MTDGAQPTARNQMKRTQLHPGVPTSHRRNFSKKALLAFTAIAAILTMAGGAAAYESRVRVRKLIAVEESVQNNRVAAPYRWFKADNLNTPQTALGTRIRPVQQAQPTDAQKLKAMTRGRLAILGIRTKEAIQSFPVPQDSFLVLIPPVGKKDKAEADRTPGLDSRKPEDKGKDRQDSNMAPSTSALANWQVKNDQAPNALPDLDRYFVCLINHLPADEKKLLADSQDGQWNDFSFLDAVLIADGITSEEREVCRSIYDHHIKKLRNETEGIEDDLERAKIVYEYLHKEILTGSYEVNHSSAADSLMSGVYNCVSATALYNALASDVGLTSFGLEMTGHAKSRIICGSSYLDIETTCPKWELLPDKPVPIPALEKKESEDGTEKETAIARNPFRQVNYLEFIQSTSAYPSEDPMEDELSKADFITLEDEEKEPVDQRRAMTISGKKPARTVTPVQFVATIYYNQAVDYYQEGMYDQAIFAYLKAIVIDPNNRTVLGNFKATLNNLAIELASNRKNYGEAIRITEHGLALDPNFDQFKANLPLYYRHWSADLRKNNEMEKAREIEERYRKAVGNQDSEPKVF